MPLPGDATGEAGDRDDSVGAAVGNKGKKGGLVTVKITIKSVSQKKEPQSKSLALLTYHLHLGMEQECTLW